LIYAVVEQLFSFSWLTENMWLLFFQKEYTVAISMHFIWMNTTSTHARLAFLQTTIKPVSPKQIEVG
jgi:hypothetical protein